MTRKHKDPVSMKKLLFLVAMMVHVASFAQTSYTLSTYTSPYAELTNATPVEIIQEEDWEEEYWDDPLFFIPLEFDFEAGDATYNSLIQLGGGAEILIGNINYEDTLLTSLTVNIFGLIDDLADRAAIPGLPSSEITHNTTGNAGNRITKIQYKDAGFAEEIYWSDSTADNTINFQLWFYEENGILEIHFGESNIIDPDLIFYENPGPGIAIGSNLNFEDENAGWGALVIGDPANPSLLQGDFYDVEGSLNAMPESGRVYRFTPSLTIGLDNTKAPEFSIYPTIAKSEIWVKDTNVANATYRIMDIAGKEIQKGKLETETSIDVSSFKTGLYIISIDGMNSSAKFIKR